MNDAHPKAVAARATAEAQRNKRNAEKEEIAFAKRQLKLRFLTVSNYTLCYRVEYRRIVEVSTAIKHPNDRTDKHAGEFLALRRFVEGNRILLRVVDQLTPKSFLHWVFSILSR